MEDDKIEFLNFIDDEPISVKEQTLDHQIIDNWYLNVNKDK